MFSSLNSDQLIAAILEDQAASYWLKGALRTAIVRDPVDALKDADILYQVLSLRTGEILAEDYRRTKEGGNNSCLTG